jgi:Cu(I)/Ag(I) efflux system membrane protein CusA/SilA
MWMPLGAGYSIISNYIFVAVIIGVIVGLLSLTVRFYPAILNYSLTHKLRFATIPVFIIIFGLVIWLGFGKVFGFMPGFVKSTTIWQTTEKKFPGLGKEFMPALDEGSFLLMPTTMPHSGVEENMEVIKLLDQKLNNIPEVENVVGKWGRVNSALDPAPVSMFENVINYKPEYALDEKGRRLRFRTDKKGAFILRDGSTYNPADGFMKIDTAMLIRDKKGEYLRQWRDKIHSPDDIWKEIIAASKIPGLTSAPKLQPIQTRLVMLQTGMRAPMGIKIYGPDLQSIEKAGMAIEKLLKEVEGVNPSSVFADRIVGKPYLEININREAIGRYGLSINDMQTYLASAVGGMVLTTTVEGRERYGVKVRFPRDYRNEPGKLRNLPVTIKGGVQVPLGELATIEFRRGPQMIKSENTFLVGYVIFDKKPGFAEVDVVENAGKYLKEKSGNRQLVLPAGVTYKFTGNYENQIRATKRLMLVIPIALFTIFLILYFQFRSVGGALMIFSGILVAFSGGFILLWLYGQPWFMNFSIGNVNMQHLFGITPVNLSVAVWVGFIALFGIATDDGVLISTYINQLIKEKKPATKEEVRKTIMEAGIKRIRPAMMTTATTLIALLPVLTSTGKGSDIMVPMSIPIFGGMLIATFTVFVVPVLFSARYERKVKKEGGGK